MRITIIREDGVVGVDGTFRTVDLTGLDPAIRAVQFDTARGRGHIEYGEEELQERDLEAERAAVAAEGEPEAEPEPIYRTVRRRRENQALESLEGFEAFIQRWQAAAPPVPPPPTLEELRARAHHDIDTKAGLVRLRYITDVPGQAATYLVKERQAEAFRAAGYAGEVPPMVQAEAEANGTSAEEACEFILAARDAWVVKGAQIERARRRGKVALDAAADEAALAAVRAAAIEELDGL